MVKYVGRAEWPDVELEEHLEKRCDYLYKHLEEIRKYCEHEWNGPILPFLPEHGIEHSKKLILFLEDILPMIHPPLSMDELFIILSSIYIHDLGMQDYTILKEKGFIKSSNIGELEAVDQEKIIDNHRKIIPDIVDKMILDTNCGHFPHHEIIAQIAMEHKKTENAIYPENKERFGGENVRLKLLISLLQCVDALHLSEDRVNINYIDQVPRESRKYWWEMYYIREVVIDQKTKRIRFHYEIPPEFQEHMEMFKHFSEKRFRRFPGDAMDVLWDYGLYLQVGGSIPWVMINHNKKMMPKEVVIDIQEYLKADNKKRIKQFQEKIIKFSRDIEDFELHTMQSKGNITPEHQS